MTTEEVEALENAPQEEPSEPAPYVHEPEEVDDGQVVKAPLPPPPVTLPPLSSLANLPQLSGSLGESPIIEAPF